MSTLRRRKRDQSRDAFVHAALELFESKGYAETAIEDIAERAVLSPSTFRRYFGTKEEVLFAGLGDSLEILRDVLAEELRQRSSPWEAVTSAVRMTTGGFLQGDPEYAPRLLKQWMTVPDLRARYVRHADVWEQAIVEAVTTAEGTDPATDTYAAALAVAAIGSFRIAIERFGSHEEVFERFEATLELMGQGLTARPKAAKKRRQRRTVSRRATRLLSQ
ncbi:TetR/AcrR family transcriptional regulator [Mycobacterium sp.]|uniref:TetR/AcrR family transcriptional regulator n=1 Tax=Mycobacterium sp. TaxID=1785 RepID=UPI0025E4DB4C|nr:TetR/AcrR family transcriptional regulator [Mycobacterium sp.]